MRDGQKERETYPVFVDGVGLPFFVVLFVETAFLDPLADIDGSEGDGRLADEEIGMGGLASAWSTGEDDNWSFGHVGEDGRKKCLGKGDGACYRERRLLPATGSGCRGWADGNGNSLSMPISIQWLPWPPDVPFPHMTLV